MRSLRLPVIALVLTTFTAASAWAGPPTTPPTPPVVTDDEKAKLEAGKLIIRDDIDDAPLTVLGIIEIHASPERVWEEILDLDARLAENKPAKDMEVYEDRVEGDTRHIKARWDIRVFGQDITWYNHYRYIASQSYFWFSLDPDEDSDIVKADGYYYILPSDMIEGGSRFIYYADTDSGRRLPDAIRTWMAHHGMKDMLKAIKNRAEL